MTRREKEYIAKQIAIIEKNSNDNNMLRNIEKMEQLIKNCSLEDLLDIEEVIMEKYLTN